MKLSIMLLASSISLSAFAESMELNIKGMTCGSCVKAVKSKVCSLEGIESCDVKVGHATLKIKEGAQLSEKTLQDAITAAGFSLEKVEKK